MELNSKLAAWATRHYITRPEVNGLLGILRMQGHNLPKVTRTLLRTPKMMYHLVIGVCTSGQRVVLPKYWLK